MAVRYEWRPTKMGRRFVRVVEPDKKVAKAAIVVEAPDPPVDRVLLPEPVEATPVVQAAPVAVPQTPKKTTTTRRRSPAKKKSDG